MSLFCRIVAVGKHVYGTLMVTVLIALYMLIIAKFYQKNKRKKNYCRKRGRMCALFAVPGGLWLVQSQLKNILLRLYVCVINVIKEAQYENTRVICAELK